MNRYVIAGNFKMNLTKEEIVSYFQTLYLLQKYQNVTPIACPVFPLLKLAKKWSHIPIGAQNVSEHERGAFTGEVSAEILASLEIPYCIIGHSERRQYFHETDAVIREKWLRLRTHNINPIICIGETLQEREKGHTFRVIKRQIHTICKDMPYLQAEDLLLAYEPVWAIGTGKTATPEMAQEVHAYIRSLLVKLYGTNAYNIPLLYGGSVKPGNIKELLTMPDINGALIGGASLDPSDFTEMVKTAGELT